MSSSIVDLFKAETEIEIKAGELFGIMREAVKAEFLMNAANCEVPYVYAREIATGEKEEHPTPDILSVFTPNEIRNIVHAAAGHPKDDAGAAGATKIYQMTREQEQGSVQIIRKNDQRVEWIDIQDIIHKGRAKVSLPVGTEINFEKNNGLP